MIENREHSPCPRVLLVLGLVVFSLLGGWWVHPDVCGASSTRLYLTPGGHLSERSSGRETVQVAIRLGDRLEWRKILTGRMMGDFYGFNLYAQNLSGASVHASVELLLQSGGSETVLASWPKGLGYSRGPGLFSSARRGPQTQTRSGDVLILRITAGETGKFHGYGSLFMGDRYPSSIDIPSLSALSDSDVGMLEGQFDPLYEDLEDIRSRQIVIQEQIRSISDTVNRLEELLVAIVTTPPEPGPRSEDGSGDEVSQESLHVYPARFSPSELRLPVEKGEVFLCTVEFGSPEKAAQVRESSVVLNLQQKMLRPTPASCVGQDMPPTDAPRYTVCFPMEEVAAPFEGPGPGTLFFSASISGVFEDNTPFVARGILRITRFSSGDDSLSDLD